jgi:hypothetical protein
VSVPAQEQALLRDFVARATLNGNDAPRLVGEQNAAHEKRGRVDTRLLRRINDRLAALPTLDDVRALVEDSQPSPAEIAQLVVDLIGARERDAGEGREPRGLGSCIYCGLPVYGRVCRAHEDLLTLEFDAAAGVSPETEPAAAKEAP